MTTNEQKTFESSKVEDISGGELRRRHGFGQPPVEKSIGDTGEDGQKIEVTDSATPKTPPATPTATSSSESAYTSESDDDEDLEDDDEPEIKTVENPLLDHNTYWLTRIVMLRCVAFICCVAFTVALNQNRALLGRRGLLPAQVYLDDVRIQAKHKLWDMFKAAPTILWLQEYDAVLDQVLDLIAYSGLLLSGMVLLLGAANIPTIFTIWVLYQSLVSIGQRWYSFGWESQVLETLFLTMLLCPASRLWHLPENSPPPITTVWLYRWLIFRIMLGAGLIKLRGDSCWRDLTCMKYHYQTQPVPNPLAYYMHQSPLWFHKWEVLVNHFVELPAPFLLLMPHRRLRQVGGIIQIAFQLLIIISGNLSFLNWLTMLPCIACFDDASLAWLFSRTTKWEVYKLQQESQSDTQPRPSWSGKLRRVFNIAMTVFIAYLSIPAVQNLLSTQQVMNTSFEPLRIVNTYGAFGSVTKHRNELIIQGAYTKHPLSPLTEWYEYGFKCKPGNLTRRPCIITPYHYRLDWLMWFAAFGTYQEHNWLVHLMAKLMVNDEAVTALMDHNPFDERDPPTHLRVETYRYTFTKLGSRAARRGQWWKRKKTGSFLPPLSLKDLEPFLQNHGWTLPRLPKDKKKGKKAHMKMGPGILDDMPPSKCPQ